MPKLRDVIMVNFGDINVALAEAGGDIYVALAGTRLRSDLVRLGPLRSVWVYSGPVWSVWVY